MNYIKTFCLLVFCVSVQATFAKPPVPPDQQAKEENKDCFTNLEAVTDALPFIEIPDLFKSEVKESKFCVDVKQYSVKVPRQKELLETYKLLDISGAIDKDGCIKEEAKLGKQGDAVATMIATFIKNNIETMPVKMLIGIDEKNDSLRLNLAVQSEKKFESTSMTIWIG